MKKLIILGCTLMALASCGSNEQSGSTTDTTAVLSPTNNGNRTTTDTLGTESAGDFTKGSMLISQSDCVGCHKEDSKLVGPAYKEIAAKYPSTDENVKHLADKIISGGKGVWGEIPMTAHPAVSKADAEEMVKYILSLK